MQLETEILETERRERERDELDLILTAEARALEEFFARLERERTEDLAVAI